MTSRVLLVYRSALMYMCEYLGHGASTGVKVKIALEQVMKAQRGSRGLALLFL
jgi:hypothetical protein